MSFAPLPIALRGIIPPVVTPLTEPDRLDLAGLERLIEHLVSGGVHGLFMLGTTGEGPSLSYRLRRELIEQTCRMVAGRLPVLVGISDTSLVESLAIAEHAAEAGAAAVVTTPPYYHPASQPELFGYLRRLLRKLPLPLVLYNMPSHTKLSWSVDLVRRVVDIPQIIALKDSSGDMAYFRRIQAVAAHRDDFSLLVGPEELLADAVLGGGHGGVCGGANLLPQLFVDLYEAALVADMPRVAALRERVRLLGARLYGIGRGPSSFVRGLKCALSLQGICDDALAEPFVRFGPAQRRAVAEGLRRLGLSAAAV